jgi:gamma-glutamylcyclotransferase (GGCT)/AIG2-like uncharacterized protein YtfP
MSDNEHLTFIVKEDNVDELAANEEFYLEGILEKVNNIEMSGSNHHGHDNADVSDLYFAQMRDYDLNYTAKQLSIICEYYEIKAAKMKKVDIIHAIVAFENNYDNIEVVMRRQQMWHYIQELKADKFMKKFIFFF